VHIFYFHARFKNILSIIEDGKIFPIAFENVIGITSYDLEILDKLSKKDISLKVALPQNFLALP